MGAVERVAADISPKGRLDVLVLSSGIYERSHEPTVFARQIAANVARALCTDSAIVAFPDRVQRASRVHQLDARA